MRASGNIEDRNAAGRARIAAGEKRMLIGGQWVAALDGKTFEITDPATGILLGSAAEASSRALVHFDGETDGRMLFPTLWS